MAFDNLPPSKPAPRRAKNEPILGVGWRVYVNCSRLAGRVPLVDAGGNPLANDLADGDEVEVMAWQPRAREGLSYQIRRLRDGSEWWIAAVYLRRLRAAQSSVEQR
jgi:hypothetical protein